MKIRIEYNDSDIKSLCIAIIEDVYKLDVFVDTNGKCECFILTETEDYNVVNVIAIYDQSENRTILGPNVIWKKE